MMLSRTKNISFLLLISLTIACVVVWLVDPFTIDMKSGSESSPPHSAKKEMRANAADTRASNSAIIGMELGDYPEINSSLTPELAKKLKAEFFLRESDIGKRCLFSSMLISQLCENGFTEEAWDMIDREYGDVRGGELGTFFNKANLPLNVLLNKIPALDVHGDKSTAFSAILTRYDLKDLEKLLSSPEMVSFMNQNMKDKFGLQVSGSVSVSIQLAIHEKSGEEFKNILEIASRFNSSGLLDANDLMLILSKSDRIQNAFEKWDIVEMVQPVSRYEPDTRRQRDDLIYTMVRSNSSLAMNQILESGGVQKTNDIHAAIRAWTAMDSKGASDWFRANRANLSSENSNKIASAFATEAMNSAELEGAQLWAGQITDAQLRAETLAAISQKRIEFDSYKTGDQ